MVKIDWSQETGFSNKGDGMFFVNIYQLCCAETIQASEPGFDGLVKA